jgi:hypothetical protein
MRAVTQSRYFPCHNATPELTLKEAFICDTYVRRGCIRKVRKKFQCQFYYVTVLHTETTHTVISKLRQTGLLLNKQN